MKNYEKLKATLQKSYYGKANLCYDENGVTLFSYDTAVAWIDSNGIFHRLWNGYSRTTAKHINDFRLLYGLPTISKKEWEALPALHNDPVYNVYISTGWTTHKCPAQLTRDECETTIDKIQRNDPRGRLVCWYE